MIDEEIAELAATVCEALKFAGISAVLTGGSCVSIWTDNEFASLDLDFITLGLHSNREIAAALAGLGFKPRKGNPRYLEHTNHDLVLEFPSGPLMVGEEHITEERIDALATRKGILRLLSPTDCVKDRLAGYYHWNDQQNFRQAVSVARKQPIDWADLEKWHLGEGVPNQFKPFRLAVEGEKIG